MADLNSGLQFCLPHFTFPCPTVPPQDPAPSIYVGRGLSIVTCLRSYCEHRQRAGRHRSHSRISPRVPAFAAKSSTRRASNIAFRNAAFAWPFILTARHSASTYIRHRASYLSSRAPTVHAFKHAPAPCHFCATSRARSLYHSPRHHLYCSFAIAGCLQFNVAFPAACTFLPCLPPSATSAFAETAHVAACSALHRQRR